MILKYDSKGGALDVAKNNDGTGLEAQSKIWELDEETWTWTNIQNMTTPRMFNSVSYINADDYWKFCK